MGSCSARNAVSLHGKMCVLVHMCNACVHLCSMSALFYMLATVMCLCACGDSDEFTILTLADIGCKNVNI